MMSAIMYGMTAKFHSALMYSNSSCIKAARLFICTFLAGMPQAVFSVRSPGAPFYCFVTVNMKSTLLVGLRQSFGVVCFVRVRETLEKIGQYGAILPQEEAAYERSEPPLARGIESRPLYFVRNLGFLDLQAEHQHWFGRLSCPRMIRRVCLRIAEHGAHAPHGRPNPARTTITISVTRGDFRCSNGRAGFRSILAWVQRISSGPEAKAVWRICARHD